MKLVLKRATRILRPDTTDETGARNRRPFAKLIKWSRKLHIWIGLTAGLYILTMSLSGTMLVFSDELSELTGPVLPATDENKPCKDFSFIAACVHRQCPGFEIEWIHKPAAKHLPLEIYLERGVEKDTALIDPHTGKLLAYRQRFIQFLMNLHFDLLFGQIGRSVNGIGATCLLSMAITGLIIWLSDRRPLLARIKVNWKANWRRVNRDGHSVAGLLALPFLVAWGLTGFYFAYPEPVKTVLNAILISPGLEPAKSQQSIGQAPVTTGSTTYSSSEGSILSPVNRFDHLVSIARVTQPELELRWIKLSKTDQLPIKVLLAPPSSELKNKLTQVFLDPAETSITQIKTPSDRTKVENLLAWMSKFHFGTIAGIYSKPIWLLFGTIPGALAISGFIIWLNRKRLLPR